MPLWQCLVLIPHLTQRAGPDWSGPFLLMFSDTFLLLWSKVGDGKPAWREVSFFSFFLSYSRIWAFLSHGLWSYNRCDNVLYFWVLGSSGSFQAPWWDWFFFLDQVWPFCSTVVMLFVDNLVLNYLQLTSANQAVFEPFTCMQCFLKVELYSVLYIYHVILLVKFRYLMKSEKVLHTTLIYTSNVIHFYNYMTTWDKGDMT